MKQRKVDTPELVSQSLEVIHNSPADCLNTILELICRRLNSDFGVILTVDKEKKELALDVLYGYPQPDAIEHRSERLKLPFVNDKGAFLALGKKKSVSAEALLEAQLSGEAKPVVRLGEGGGTYPITTEDVKQVMGYAVKTMDEYVGVLTLETLEENGFGDYITPAPEQTELLKICSNLISVALAVRQSLVFKFDELIKERNFNDIKTLSKEVINWVLDKFKVNSCAIYFIEYDPNTDQDYVVCKERVIDGHAETDLSDAVYPMGKGLCGWVALHNASLILTEFENQDSKELSHYEKRYQGDKPTRTGKFRKKHGDSLQFKSYLGVPLNDGKNLIGVLEILDPEREYAFSDEGLLEMIGYRVALEYNRITKDRRRESLFEIPKIETSDIRDVIKGVVDAAMNLTSATHGFFMYKEEGGHFSPRSVKGHQLRKEDIKEVQPEDDEKNLVHWVITKHDYFVCQDIKNSDLTDQEKRHLDNSMTPGGFILPSIQSLLMVPVYLVGPAGAGGEGRAEGEKNYEDLGVLVLMSSKANAFQQDEVLITALAEIVAYHIWGNMKMAELASERQQVSKLKQAMNNYKLAITATTASAGTVHTAKKHVFAVSEAMKKIVAHKKIREDKDLLLLAEKTAKQFTELQDLYNRLHNVFRGIEPNFELCDLAALVQEARTYMEQIFRERGIDFRSSLKSSSLPKVKADAILMKVVFINLIRNSIDANARVITVTGGVIWVGDEQHKREMVEVTFQDDGIGIPKEDQKDLFDLFFSANKKEGTGLGLAVNRDILDKHRGTIKIAWSEVGRGTAITVTWPVRPSKPVA